MLSVLDIFRIGIGPSSSHTVGPMRIGKRFVSRLTKDGILESTKQIKIVLRGSLAFTGEGHATPKATIYGLLGYSPEIFDAELASKMLSELYNKNQILLNGSVCINFSLDSDLLFDYETPPKLHPNEIQMTAFNFKGNKLLERIYYSTGGGFIASLDELSSPLKDDIVSHGYTAPLDFGSAEDLLSLCEEHGMSIDEVIIANEDAIRDRLKTDRALNKISKAMFDCIDRGLNGEGVLPGGLNVRRRSPDLWKKLIRTEVSNEREQLFDWLNVYALAVSEENASGGQVVTAPTNGAAGIIPAVIRHYCYGETHSEKNIQKFLLTAGGIGLLYKQRASISGAEMGCQGEVGVACSMAAAGLAAIWGGSPQQIVQAAEIGMEHNLGLTCDPVGGLVQIPCIERNAIGTVKAVNAARLSLHSDRKMKVSLDQVIETMRQTGLDMSTKYKETSQGGLAVNVVEC